MSPTVPPTTERAPLSAASALGLAVEATAPAELTLEHVHGVALEALGKAEASMEIAKGADNRTLATEAKLATMQAAMSRTEAGVNDLKRDRADDRSFIENALGGIKTAIASRERHDAAQDAKLVDVARVDEEVTKRISIAEIRVADVDKRVGKLEGWIAANPKTAGAIGGSLSVATLLGLATTFGPSLLRHLALAWAVAHGIPTPPALPPEPAPIVAPQKDQPR